MQENKAIKFIKSKGLMEDFEKFKEVPKVVFKIIRRGNYDFVIRCYVNGDFVQSMFFDENDDFTHKVYHFNNMIENVYKELGIRASQEEMRDTLIPKYGFNINSVISDWDIDSSYIYLYALTLNHSSNNIEKTKLVYDAISEHRDYLMEAFGHKIENKEDENEK